MNKSGCVQSPAPKVSQTKVMIACKMDFFVGGTDGEKTDQIQGLCVASSGEVLAHYLDRQK